MATVLVANTSCNNSDITLMYLSVCVKSYSIDSQETNKTNKLHRGQVFLARNEFNLSIWTYNGFAAKT